LADGGGRFAALGFATTVQHYQHLLGYELRNVVQLARNVRRAGDAYSHRPSRQRLWLSSCHPSRRARLSGLAG
jgi:hypothetical protein